MAKIERQSLNNISINQLMILTNKCGRFPRILADYRLHGNARTIILEWR
jgi:hypothetical protein